MSTCLIISIVLSCIFIGDLGLYGYWNFRLDTTPLFYLASSPKDALASAGAGVLLAGLVAVAGLCRFIVHGMLLRAGKTETGVEDSVQTPKCFGCAAARYRTTVHPHSGQLRHVDHECGQRPTSAAINA